jgi:hypothetical protein
MAHVDHWEFGGDAGMDLEFFYNVTQAVGPLGTAPNRRDDVMLVQYLLTSIVGTVVMAGGRKTWIPPGSDRRLTVDGRMGPDTAAWIKSYQDGLSAIVSKDGRVDRALGANASIAHVRYTILALNHHFLNAEPEKFRALEDDDRAPAGLRTAIRSSRPKATPGLPFESPGLPAGADRLKSGANGVVPR